MALEAGYTKLDIDLKRIGDSLSDQQPANPSDPSELTPDDAYKHFMEHREELPKFDPSNVDA